MAFYAFGADIVEGYYLRLKDGSPGIGEFILVIGSAAPGREIDMYPVLGSGILEQSTDFIDNTIDIRIASSLQRFQRQ